MSINDPKVMNGFIECFLCLYSILCSFIHVKEIIMFLNMLNSFLMINLMQFYGISMIIVISLFFDIKSMNELVKIKSSVPDSGIYHERRRSYSNIELLMKVIHN